MTSDIAESRIKVPLAWSAHALADLCEKIDAGSDIDQALKLHFEETRLDMVAGVDRRIAFDSFISGAIEQAERIRDGWTAQVKRLTAVKERFRDTTKQIIEAFPDLPYTGHLGRLSVQNNSSTKVNLLIETGRKSFDYLVNEEAIINNGIDPKYLKTITLTQINTEALKADLNLGMVSSFASIGRGTHLRVKHGI